MAVDPSATCSHGLAAIPSAVETATTTSEAYQEIWWQKTVPLLAKMLSSTNMNPSHQEVYTSFFAQTLLPMLGPYPQQFRSVITRSGLPVEFSVNYQQHGGIDPVWRIGFEPVGKDSGSPEDPYNQAAISDLLRALARLQLAEYDTSLLDHFVTAHTVSVADRKLLQGQQMECNDTSRSQVAFGFDLKNGTIAVKGYTFPAMKCKATGKDFGTIVRESIAPLTDTFGSLPAFDLVDDYMMKTDGYSDVAFFSWDCVAPIRSRFKLYSATNDVVWSKVEEIWTLGGRVSDPTTLKGLYYLQRLWKLLRITEGYRAFNGGFDDGTDSTPTPIVWNYEMRPGALIPVTKFYFPIHGQNDITVVRGLAEFLQEIGLAEHGLGFEQTVREYYPELDLNKTACLTSWISFAYTEQTGVYLSVYYHSSLDYPWALDKDQ
ncbi:hypothetical protein BDV24DRAFT_147754 [Aspergillus arachidicola]|uniref:Tryptophan dimethylallyltransferase n=1 Tax=Aspergillus arachidicola TaxID=656916 RepID=A0A2G7FVV7_9EURO|nr:hypothetical protein BDV24DRAFT_147754 [Aspergillus arachidicola]PIG84001.1 hypothetical protein AARAC_006324 [Aspergillus arachidicola]